MTGRRSRGEGSIYRREDGLWVGQIYVNGKKKVKYSKLQKDVREWLHEQKEAVNRGMFVGKKDLTLGAYIEQYMETQKNTLRESTFVNYSQLIAKHILPELGEIKLSQLRPDTIQSYYSAKINSGLSKRSVQYIHAILHKALKMAVKWELVSRNVTDFVESPRPVKTPPSIWTVEQSRRFLEGTKSSRFYPMYCLAFIGMRVGEILGVGVEDFDQKNRTITIKQQVQFIPGQGLKITVPKTESSKRTIKLPDFIYEALKAHILKENQRLMFETSNGTPFSYRNFVARFKKNAEKLGLPEIRFHDLRHFAVSYLINELKIPPRVVQDIIGHATINLTLSVYSHSTTDQQGEAMDKMSSAFLV